MYISLIFLMSHYTSQPLVVLSLHANILVHYPLHTFMLCYTHMHYLIYLAMHLQPLDLYKRFEPQGKWLVQKTKYGIHAQQDFLYVGGGSSNAFENCVSRVTMKRLGRQQWSMGNACSLESNVCLDKYVKVSKSSKKKKVLSFQERSGTVEEEEEEEEEEVLLLLLTGEQYMSGQMCEGV